MHEFFCSINTQYFVKRSRESYRMDKAMLSCKDIETHNPLNISEIYILSANASARN